MQDAEGVEGAGGGDSSRGWPIMPEARSGGPEGAPATQLFRERTSAVITRC